MYNHKWKIILSILVLILFLHNIFNYIHVYRFVTKQFKLIYV